MVRDIVPPIIILTDRIYSIHIPQALRAEDNELAAYLEGHEHFQLIATENQETAV